MAGGWARDGAEQEQIESTLEEGVEWARRQLPQGESRHFCEECDEPIPEPRRKALPGVKLCVTCQAEQDKHATRASGYNRRGSKDSQLR
ncbi:DksA/TraR family C4-type zinc finger protein [Halomonas sp. HNIBRBA4712]|uniref:DksA/TraR family C4-type zinc finger protein n=1 Tax=Halomonas sp. HNIBRBA4712 TaxID=3373087 RepID=UPI003745571E